MSPRSRVIRPRAGLVAALLIFSSIGAFPSPALAGTLSRLDLTFSGDGKVTTDFTGGDDLALGVAVQPDGKIVAVGGAGGSGGRFALARYNTGGSLDTGFGGDGKVATNFTSGRDFAAGVAIQADERIVAAGTANFGGDARFALARYNTDGSLDTGFSGDGKVATNFTFGYDFADDVTIEPTGDKIVAAGAANFFGGDPRFALARYNADGTLDTGFSGDGKLTTNFTGGDDYAFGVVIQPADGKIVSAGGAGGSGGRFALARYNADGTLDSTFSGDGKLTTNFTGGDDYADDVVLQPSDGKIVAAGAGNASGSNPTFALARYNTDGTLDTGFSGDGKVTTNFTGGADFAVGMDIQPVGEKIVCAGRAGGSGGRFALARYFTD